MMRFNRHLICCLTLCIASCSTPKKPTSKASSLDEDGAPAFSQHMPHPNDATPQIEPLSKYGNPAIYTVRGKQYKTMKSSDGFETEGVASWYGKKFHGRRTSSGEVYDMFAMTAAHKHLPLPTYAVVKNLKNDREIIVKINDRGPFMHDRIIDLSYAAAKKLDIHHTGTAKVRITAIDPIAWHQDQNTRLADVVRPDPETHLADLQQVAAAQAVDDAKPSTKKIYLQLGAFQEKRNADVLAQKANILTQALDHLPVHIKPHHRQNKPIYKVRIGPMKDRAEAIRVQKELLSLDTPSPVALIYD